MCLSTSPIHRIPSSSHKQELNRQANNKEYNVVFLIMTKQISSEVMCEYDVVVVCCKKCKKRETKEFWKSRDYSIHSVSHRSKTFDKQLCKILFQSDQNMPIRQSVLLQFNARKHNYIQIQIKCEQNSLSEVLSNIEIQKLFINSFNHSTPGDFIVKMKHAHRKHKPDSSASHRIGSNETNTAALVTQKTTTWREDLYCQGKAGITKYITQSAHNFK